MRTDRLLLRAWKASDLEPFAAMNADPRVMEFFPTVLTAEETRAMIGRIEAHFERHGFGPWAVEAPDGSFIGFVGLMVPTWAAHFTPCVEIGWRIAFDHWGRGYATEAAREALKYGFEQLGLKEIVSLTTVTNRRSRHVMEKLGMEYSPADDFDHPNIAEGHPLRKHVLYRLKRA